MMIQAKAVSGIARGTGNGTAVRYRTAGAAVAALSSAAAAPSAPAPAAPLPSLVPLSELLPALDAHSAAGLKVAWLAVNRATRLRLYGQVGSSGVAAFGRQVQAYYHIPLEIDTAIADDYVRLVVEP